MNDPSFWNDQEKANATIQEMKGLSTLLDPFDELLAQAEELETLIDLAEESGEGELNEEVETLTRRARKAFEEFELRSMLDGPNDHCNAYLSIHAGAGGTEACDWAAMLQRMYSMWANGHKYSVEVVDSEEGSDAGIQSATLHIKGEMAYGYLRCESGVHRLVRISPFDASGRRQTSFASVDVIPEVDDSIDIEIKDCDLRRDVFRSGGPGGQHQNKTESGVRYTHIPTGVSAEARSERSQHKNDALAMAVLKARLIKLEEDKRAAEYAKAYDEKSEISFGSQIRSYVLHPYSLVKDARTSFESGNPRAVLDGDLDGFIDSFLRMKLSQGEPKS